jgi:tetratricopeptide (TPR) repeat protein
MNVMKYMIVLLVATAMTGCAALIGPSTSDPAVKLKWASENFNSLDQPVKAEEQIWDVIETYKKERNQLGLAEAYRQYALFLRSNTVDKFADHFKEEGFVDSTVTFETRYEKAIDYFNRSKDLYEDYGHIDVISNLYVSLGKTYDLMGKTKEACESFDKGLENYADYRKANPEAQELRSEEMANYEEYIGIIKKQAGCP